MSLILSLLIFLQAPQALMVKRFDVLRVNTEDLRRLPNSMRAIFVDPVPDGVPVKNLEEAAQRAGFMPRIVNGQTPKRLYVTNMVNDEVVIAVAVLNDAIREAKVQGVTVPSNWDGVSIGLKQSPGILVDYGDFYIAQGPPRTMTVPANFPLAQYMEALFRIMGIESAKAGALRDSFAANPTSYLPIAPRFEMDIRQIPLTANAGLLLQNADKGGEIAFMWTAGERSYFLTGQVTEEQAVAIAKSFQ
jgi:hypothetical protein